MFWLMWVACGPRVLVDTADACLSSDAEGVITADVVAYGGETGPTEVWCRLEEQDGVLVLPTGAAYNRDRSPFTSTLIARTAFGSCTWGPAADGVVAVQYDTRGRELDVPGGEVCFQ